MANAKCLYFWNNICVRHVKTLSMICLDFVHKACLSHAHLTNHSGPRSKASIHILTVDNAILCYEK